MKFSISKCIIIIFSGEIKSSFKAKEFIDSLDHVAFGLSQDEENVQLPIHPADSKKISNEKKCFQNCELYSWRIKRPF